MWIQRTIRLPAQPRGFHLVTAEVLEALPELGEISVDRAVPRSLVATATGEPAA